MVKCNVYKTAINYDILNKSIFLYEKNNEGKHPNYLVMNYKTFNVMKADSIYDYYRGTSLVGMFDKKEYHGIPIAIADHLEDGDIDIV